MAKQGKIKAILLLEEEAIMGKQIIFPWLNELMIGNIVGNSDDKTSTHYEGLKDSQYYGTRGSRDVSELRTLVVEYEDDLDIQEIPSTIESAMKRKHLPLKNSQWVVILNKHGVVTKGRTLNLDFEVEFNVTVIDGKEFAEIIF